MSQQETPPIVAGFIEGLVLPLVELVFSVFILASTQLVESLDGDPTFVILLFLMVGIADFTRNIVIGLRFNQFAIGNLIGSFFGLWLFYSLVATVSEEAASHAVWLTVVLAASLGAGIYFRFFHHNNS